VSVLVSLIDNLCRINFWRSSAIIPNSQSAVGRQQFDPIGYSYKRIKMNQLPMNHWPRLFTIIFVIALGIGCSAESEGLHQPPAGAEFSHSYPLFWTILSDQSGWSSR
jgi:hypothetical protein